MSGLKKKTEGFLAVASEKIETALEPLGIVQCVALYGLGGLVLSANTAHAEITSSLTVTHEQIKAYTNEALIDNGGYLDIVFDSINFVKHWKKAFSDVEQDIQAEELLYRIKSLEKKNRNADQDEMLQRLQSELDAHVQSVETYQKRLRYFLAMVWTFLLGRSVMSNTPLLVMHLGASFSLPALSIAMAFKAFCKAIDLYYLNKEIEQNKISQNRISREIHALLSDSTPQSYGQNGSNKAVIIREQANLLLEVDLSNTIRNAQLTEDVEELDDLLVQHAMRLDEEQLLKAKARQVRWDIGIYSSLSIGMAISAGLAASAVCPPIAGGILIAIGFIGIGLYVIPSLLAKFNRERKERECLTNIVQLRENRAKIDNQDLTLQKELAFKSPLHRLKFIDDHYSGIQLQDGAIVSREDAKKAILLDREAIRLRENRATTGQLLGQAYATLQEAFTAKAQLCSTAIGEIIATLRQSDAILDNQNQARFTPEHMKVLHLHIQSLARYLLEMKAMERFSQDVMVLPANLQAGENAHYFIFIEEMLLTLQHDTFFHGSADPEPQVNNVLRHLGAARHTRLNQFDDAKAVKKASHQLVEQYETMVKRSERAHQSTSRFVVQAIFSPTTVWQTYRDRRALEHLEIQRNNGGAAATT